MQADGAYFGPCMYASIGLHNPSLFDRNFHLNTLNEPDPRLRHSRTSERHLSPTISCLLLLVTIPKSFLLGTDYCIIVVRDDLDSYKGKPHISFDIPSGESSVTSSALNSLLDAVALTGDDRYSFHSYESSAMLEVY